MPNLIRHPVNHPGGRRPGEGGKKLEPRFSEKYLSADCADSRRFEEGKQRDEELYPQITPITLILRIRN
jgi:hypothetical protein